MAMVDDFRGFMDKHSEAIDKKLKDFLEELQKEAGEGYDVVVLVHKMHEKQEQCAGVAIFTGVDNPYSAMTIMANGVAVVDHWLGHQQEQALGQRKH